MIRNPQILLTLIGMPLILITILGFALGGVMSGEQPSIEAKVAIVEQRDGPQELERFLKDLEQTNIPNEGKEAIAESASQLLPMKILKEEVLGNPELKKYIMVEEKKPEELDDVREDDSYSAIIEVPKDFTYNILHSLFLEGNKRPTLKVYQNEGKELTSNIMKDLLTGFQEQYSLSSTIGKSSGFIVDASSMGSGVKGEIAYVEDKVALTSTAFYAVGMSVMFVLYIASNMGSFAFREKEDHVFDRIILANVSIWKYFSSILATTVILAFLQLGILFGVCALLYGVTWPNMISFMIVTVFISLAVGSIGTLLTSLNYRANSETFSSFFSTVVVTVFAFIGGSFGQLFSSDFIQTLGSLTPNGAGMTAYFKIFQGYNLMDVYPEIASLLIFTFVILVLSIILFPREGGKTV